MFIRCKGKRVSPKLRKKTYLQDAGHHPGDRRQTLGECALSREMEQRGHGREQELHVQLEGPFLLLPGEPSRTQRLRVTQV